MIRPPSLGAKTQKSTCALVCGKPIVTPDYFTAALEAKKNNMPTTEYTDYIPEPKGKLWENSDVDLKVNKKRRTLFSGKRFVFIKEDKLLQIPVKLAGGKVCLIEDLLLSQVRNDIFVGRSPSLSQLNDFPQIKSKLSSQGNCIVQESDVGLAILNC